MKRLIACTMIGSLALFAACGDDDSASDETTASDDTTATDDSTSAQAEGFCGLAEQLDEMEEVEENFGDPQALETAMTEMSAAVDEAVAEAPDEIASDMELLAGAFKNLGDELAKVDYNFLDMRVGPFAELDENPEFKAAGDSIDQYGEAECGIPAEDDGDDDESPFAGLPEDATVRDSMVMSFNDQGISKKGAQCIGDALEPTDFVDGDLPDESVVRIFDDCGLDPRTGKPVKQGG